MFFTYKISYQKKNYFNNLNLKKKSIKNDLHSILYVQKTNSIVIYLIL